MPQSYPSPRVLLGQPLSGIEMKIEVKLSRVARARIVTGSWLLKLAARVMGFDSASITYKRSKP